APETWHPTPRALYEAGAGPLLDMGPYYLTALVFLLGPIARVAGFSTSAPMERRDRATGARLVPEVPTHEVGLLEFASGVVASLTLSYDVAPAGAPRFELCGTEGAIRLPDPSEGGGVLAVCRRGD